MKCQITYYSRFIMNKFLLYLYMGVTYFFLVKQRLHTAKQSVVYTRNLSSIETYCAGSTDRRLKFKIIANQFYLSKCYFFLAQQANTFDLLICIMKLY